MQAVQKKELDRVLGAAEAWRGASTLPAKGTLTIALLDELDSVVDTAGFVSLKAS